MTDRRSIHMPPEAIEKYQNKPLPKVPNRAPSTSNRLPRGEDRFPDISTLSDIQDDSDHQALSDTQDASGRQTLANVQDGSGYQSYSDVQNTSGYQTLSNIQNTSGYQTYSDAQNVLGYQTLPNAQNTSARQTFSSVQDAPDHQAFYDFANEIPTPKKSTGRNLTQHASLVTANTTAGESFDREFGFIESDPTAGSSAKYSGLCRANTTPKSSSKAVVDGFQATGQLGPQTGYYMQPRPVYAPLNYAHAGTVDHPMASEFKFPDDGNDAHRAGISRSNSGNAINLDDALVSPASISKSSIGEPVFSPHPAVRPLSISQGAPGTIISESRAESRAARGVSFPPHPGVHPLGLGHAQTTTPDPAQSAQLAAPKPFLKASTSSNSFRQNQLEMELQTRSTKHLPTKKKEQAVTEGRLAHKRWSQGRTKRTWRECWAVELSIAGLKDRFFNKTGFTMGIVVSFTPLLRKKGLEKGSELICANSFSLVSSSSWLSSSISLPLGLELMFGRRHLLTTHLPR